MGGVFFYTRGMSEALVIIDIQNDYFPGGAMELVGAKEASLVAARLKADFAANAKPIFVVQHIAKTRPFLDLAPMALSCTSR